MPSKGAIPKARSEGKFNWGGPFAGMAMTLSLGRASEKSPASAGGDKAKKARDAVTALAKAIEEMNRFTREHKNAHASLKEGLSKAALLMRQVERGWCWAEKELSGLRGTGERATASTSTQTEAQPRTAEREDARPRSDQEMDGLTGGAKRKQTSPCAGATEKRPCPEAVLMEEGAAEAANSTKTEEGWTVATKRVRPKKKKRGATEPPTQLQKPQQQVQQQAQQQRGQQGALKIGGRRQARPDAVLIKTSGSANYAEVLRTIKRQVDPEKTGAQITAVKKTRGGDVLVELKRGSSGVQALRDAVAGALGQGNKVAALEPMLTVEVRDLDDVTEAAEVKEALYSTLQVEVTGEVRMRRGYNGTQVALLRLPERMARRILAVGKVKVGWCVCRIRERVAVDKCFRCQGYGHRSGECVGADCSNACRRCGKAGHKEKDCQASPSCLLCSKNNWKADHFTGSGRCRAFREELSKAKGRCWTGSGTSFSQQPRGGVPKEGRIRVGTMPRVTDSSGHGGTLGVRILQVNLNRSRAAQDLLVQTAASLGASILLVSEPSGAGKAGPWMPDKRGDAAITVTRNFSGSVTPGGQGEGFVWAGINQTCVFSCYFSPNARIEVFERQLDELEEQVRAAGNRILIAGDFNAKSPLWGSATWDVRGRMVAEFLARLDLSPINTGEAPTWRRAATGSESVIDITAGSPGVAAEVREWRVLEEESLSDHRYIYMEWALSAGNRTKQGGGRDPATAGWVTRKLDKAAMATCLGEEKRKRGSRPTDIGDSEVDVLMHTIIRACDAGMPRRKPPRGKPAAHWWTDRIAQLRRECVSARRRAQRARAKSRDADASMAAYRMAKRDLRNEIKASKARCWEELLQAVDEDPWGLPYKLVTKKLGVLRQPDDPVTVENILTELFPVHRQSERSILGAAATGPHPEPFTLTELYHAARRISGGKAPGPDGVPGEALAVVAENYPEALLRAFNECLQQGSFHPRWKRQRLVLLPKGQAKEGSGQKYRPISLIDVTGKLLERLLHARLEAALDASGGLADNQYGFRRGRSTIHAIDEVVDIARKANERKGRFATPCLMVLLDVKNAFNAVGHQVILDALERRNGMPAYLVGMVGSYLEDRLLLYRTSEGEKTRRLSAGVPQGSVLGPLLWNVAYDDLLRMKMPDGVTTVGFADDVALVVTARTTDLLEAKTTEAVSSAWAWLTQRGLDLAEKKTEVVVLTRRYTLNVNPIQVKGHEVTPTGSAKYLGVTIDAKLNFAEHVQQAASKAMVVAASIGRLMPNIGGPVSGRRRLLASVTYSVPLYGAPVWADALSTQRNRSRLEAAGRACALRVVSAYRTVSTPAAMVLAGLIPLHLLAAERKRISDAETRGGRLSKLARGRLRRDEREQTVKKWDEEWRVEDKGAWTRVAIPSVMPWFDRGHGRMNFHLTQGLTGHGCFGAYLHRIGREETAKCHHCGEALDDANHTWFVCKAWNMQREDMWRATGRVQGIQDLVKAMLEGPEKWKAAADFTDAVLRAKEEAERRRRREGRTVGQQANGAALPQSRRMCSTSTWGASPGDPEHPETSPTLATGRRTRPGMRRASNCDSIADSEGTEVQCRTMERIADDNATPRRRCQHRQGEQRSTAQKWPTAHDSDGRQRTAAMAEEARQRPNVGWSGQPLTGYRAPTKAARGQHLTGDRGSARRLTSRASGARAAEATPPLECAESAETAWAAQCNTRRDQDITQGDSNLRGEVSISYNSSDLAAICELYCGLDLLSDSKRHNKAKVKRLDEDQGEEPEHTTGHVAGYLRDIGTGEPVRGDISREFEKILRLSQKHAEALRAMPPPTGVAAARPTTKGVTVRMTYGDVNYLGNNKAVLYLRRRRGRQQRLVNSTSPLKMHPPGNDLVVLDGVVFTAPCECDSPDEHARVFPQHRTTVAEGVTCANGKLARLRGEGAGCWEGMCVLHGNSEVTKPDVRTASRMLCRAQGSSKKD
ncbi:uncharacterized protein LOC124409152 [Diprion similis]|uniref:uncharacterized protein LOC124409152 n=1 Tax=Diprion similis TaxID=362088 RepID=UPI001EF90DBD|nr:uncharacterized protein LOC124409152 [Diprion similis]